MSAGVTTHSKVGAQPAAVSIRRAVVGSIDALGDADFALFLYMVVGQSGLSSRLFLISLLFHVREQPPDTPSDLSNVLVCAAERKLD